jgi:peptide chain release factor 2
LSSKQKRLKELKNKQQQPQFWNNPEKARLISQEIAQLEEEQQQLTCLQKDLDELYELAQSIIEEKDKTLIENIKKELHNWKQKFIQLENFVYLGGEYGRGNAFLFFYAGTGGQDAEDWTSMLIRMYARWAEKKGFEVKEIERSLSEDGLGTKSATIEIKGKYAYGLLKGEAGVHRLVRISPFSAQKLRHTSFALLEVIPDIPETEHEKIKPDELRIDTYRSSGPGGQNVNRRETAVRVTHIPTNISVASQAERSQAQNKERALKLLAIKLHERKRQEKEALEKEQRSSVNPTWGAQRRTYVFHPYKQIRDHLTGLELSDVEKVMEGGLDELIEAGLRIKNHKSQIPDPK